MLKISYLVSLLSEAVIDTSIPTPHFKFYLVYQLFIRQSHYFQSKYLQLKEMTALLEYLDPLSLLTSCIANLLHVKTITEKGSLVIELSCTFQ